MHLETLKWIKAKNLIRKAVVLKFADLRNLGIISETREEVEMVMRSPLLGSGLLRPLEMKISQGSCFPSLEPLLGCSFLTKLELDGAIGEHPQSLQHNLE